MRHLCLFEAPSKHFVARYPQEDDFRVSTKYPIFVVADGVHLCQFDIEHRKYPEPSPAGEVAKLFCVKAIETVETLYKSFNKQDIERVFRIANDAVGSYNRAHGRTKETVDWWDTDYYAATAALAVIKDNTVYWGSVCDSYVMHFNNNGLLCFQSPTCTSKKQVEPPEYTGDPNDLKAKTQYKWRVRRNGVNDKGQRIGYGVITGEPEALLYLSNGTFSIQSGDLVEVLTDGFEEYMKLPRFISLHTNWSVDLQSRLKQFTSLMANRNQEKYGRERTLLIVSV